MIAVVMVYLRLRNSGTSEANIFFERYGGEENQDSRVRWIRIQIFTLLTS